MEEKQPQLSVPTRPSSSPDIRRMQKRRAQQVREEHLQGRAGPKLVEAGKPSREGRSGSWIGGAKSADGAGKREVRGDGLVMVCLRRTMIGREPRKAKGEKTRRGRMLKNEPAGVNARLAGKEGYGRE